MQYVEPCEFCGGVIKADGTRWRCTKCRALWTLGMKLIDEGSVMGAALDAVLGTAETRPQSLRVDTVYHYRPPGAGIQAKCRLRLYWHDGKDVAILTTLADNPGMSVTNAVEHIAGGLVRQYELAPVSSIFIEDDGSNVFDLVHFMWEGETPCAPQWRRMSVEEVERLTGDFFGDTAELADLAEMME